VNNMKTKLNMNAAQIGNHPLVPSRKAPLLGLTFLLAINLLPRCYGSDRDAIQPGETKTSIQLSGPSYMDTWTFSGNAGDRVVINAVTTSGTLDTAVVLYPPSGGSAEASTQSSLNGGGDQLDWQLGTNGVYTILVEDNSLGQPGTYNITLTKIPGTVNSAGDPDGGPIASGQTLGGHIQVPSDMDCFQFFGNVGDRVIINAVATNGTLDTAIILYPPGGGPAEAATPSALNGGGDQLDSQLATNGLYTIVIEDNGLYGTGGYNVTLTKIPGTVNSAGDLDGGAIASGQSKTGSIQVPSDMDPFQFYAGAGDRVVISAVAVDGTLDTAIILYPPGGGPAEAATPSALNGGGDQLDWQVQTNGLYTILIEDNGLSGTGTYNISLSKIPSTLRPGLYNPRPAVGTTITNSLELGWDPVPGATGYDLYFGQNVTAPLSKVGTNFAGASFPLPTTQPGSTYVWHVVAHTAAGQVDGPYWWFAVGFPSLRLATPILLSDRRCQVGLQGYSIQPVRLQASTNLADWNTLTTVANLNGNFDYLDSGATNFTSRFYRAVSP
jgi:hypothetical protein